MDGITDIATYIGQSLAQGTPLVPAIIALTALINGIANPPTRWKPAISVTLGMVLGGLLFLRISNLWYDGMWVGLVAALVAMKLWQQGKDEENKPVTSSLTTTTTLTTPPEPAPPEPPEPIPPSPTPVVRTTSTATTMHNPTWTAPPEPPPSVPR